MENIKKENKSIVIVVFLYLNGNRSMSLSLNDYFGMAQYGLALGGQISEADKTNTGKVIAESIIPNRSLGRLFNQSHFFRVCL